jgi:acetyl esterase
MGIPGLKAFNDMIRHFGLLNALSNVPATRIALHQAPEELRAKLSK